VPIGSRVLHYLVSDRFMSIILSDCLLHVITFQLLSLFVMTIFSDSRGFAGLFLATLYGGALRLVNNAVTNMNALFCDCSFILR